MAGGGRVGTPAGRSGTAAPAQTWWRSKRSGLPCGFGLRCAEGRPVVPGAARAAGRPGSRGETLEAALNTPSPGTSTSVRTRSPFGAGRAGRAGDGAPGRAPSARTAVGGSSPYSELESHGNDFREGSFLKRETSVRRVTGEECGVGAARLFSREIFLTAVLAPRRRPGVGHDLSDRQQLSTPAP